MGISAGESHSVLWTDTGKVLGTGMNKYGQIASQLPRVVEFSLIPIDKVTSVACGSTHTVVLVNVCLYEKSINFKVIIRL